jgi:glycosyltransferase involved in cell wall biosynthesis
MKIAFFTESLPPKTDGVSHTLVQLIHTLGAHHHEFIFFAPFKPDTGVAWQNRVHKVPSLRFVLYNEYRLSLPISEIVGPTLDQFKPDVIHTVSPTPMGLFARNYALRNHMPAVSSYHTHFVSYFPYYGVRFLERLGWGYLRWYYNQFAMTYAPSPNTVEELKTKGIRRVELWPRGVDTRMFSPRFKDGELKKSINAENEPILLFVGRLVKEKDLDDLVTAGNLLAERGCGFKLVLVGDGPMRAELMHRLPDAHFTGFQYGHALSRWYATADLFLFPSTTETFGNVIQEAFASGIPAVGVNKEGSADLIIPGKNGMLAAPNNPPDFARKVELLLRNPYLRLKMGKNALATASNNSWTVINLRLLESYEQILSTFHSKAA